MNLTEQEFDILDELYFVISWHDLKEALRCDDSWLKDGLRTLLEKRFVQQFTYSEAHHDFVRLGAPDSDHPEKYHYLATKEGLLAHNL